VPSRTSGTTNNVTRPPMNRNATRNTSRVASHRLPNAPPTLQPGDRRMQRDREEHRHGDPGQHLTRRADQQQQQDGGQDQTDDHHRPPGHHAGVVLATHRSVLPEVDATNVNVQTAPCSPRGFPVNSSPGGGYRAVAAYTSATFCPRCRRREWRRCGAHAAATSSRRPRRCWAGSRRCSRRAVPVNPVC
jgi:hypothetical protein